MRHSTTTQSRTAVTPLRRSLAIGLSSALVLGAVALGSTPASAATAGTVTNASLSWGFQTGADAWRIETVGATPNTPTTVSTSITRAPMAPFQTSKGFTLTGGTGSVDAATSVATVDFTNTVTYYPQWSYATLVPDQPWISFSDFTLTTSSSSRGSLSALVSWHKANGSNSAAPVRAQLANFDIASISADEGNLALTSAAPDWVNVVPAGTYSGTYTDSWPTELNTALLPLTSQSDFNVYFYRTGTTAGNTAKTPLPLTVSAGFVVGSTVTLSADATQVTAGSTTTLTAAVAPAADGTITFSDGPAVLAVVPVANGSASFTTSALAIGTHSIVASFSGSSTVGDSTSATVDVTVADVPAAATPVPAAPVVVAPVAAKLAAKVTLSAKAFKKNTKPTVSVTLPKLANGTYASGNVRVYVNGKSVKVVKLTTSKKGKVTVTLPKKYSKSIKVSVKFGGSTTVKAVTSKTVKYTVKK